MVRALREVDPMGRVHTNLASQTHLLLKAFLPGVNLGQLTHQRAMQVFGPVRMRGGGASETWTKHPVDTYNLDHYTPYLDYILLTIVTRTIYPMTCKCTILSANTCSLDYAVC